MRKQFLFAAATAVIFFSLQQATAQSPYWSLLGNANATSESKLGTTTPIALRFITSNEERMRIGTDGKVGIGITSSVGKLTIRNNGSTPAGSWVTFGAPVFTSFAETTGGNADHIFGMASNTFNARPNLIGKRARGTLAAPAAVANNDYINSFQASGYDGSAFQNAANIDFFVDGTPSSGNVPMRISFSTGTNLGNRTERLAVKSNGNVGIGTTEPERKLHVFNGSAGVVTSRPNAPLVVENNTACYVNLLAPEGSESAVLFGNAGNAADGGVFYLNSTDAMTFRTNGVDARMTLSSAGNLDITGGTLSFGSVETLSDAGNNTIGSNSDLVPTTNATSSFTGRALGNSNFKWREVWAFDGTINTSDERDKANVRELEYGIKEIMKLRATRFNWKADNGKNEKIGLIAQELKKVLPEVVRDWEYKQTAERGSMEKVATERMGVMYSDIIPVLIKGMQEQQQQIEKQEQQIEKLTEIVAKLANGQNVTPVKGVILSQSTPNPAKSSARISYSIPDGSRAQLLLTDAAGKMVKAISLTQAGYVDVSTAGLSSGIYNYTLVVNGKLVETKKLTVVR